MRNYVAYTVSKPYAAQCDVTREQIRTHYIKKIVHSGRGETIPLEQTMCRVASSVDPV